MNKIKSENISVSLIYCIAKPSLKTSPDHFFGNPNVICFAFRKGEFLYADKDENKNLVFLNESKLIETTVEPRQMHHSNMFSHYKRATGKDTNKKDWIRGRTGEDGKSLNIWNDQNVNDIKMVVQNSCNKT